MNRALRRRREKQARQAGLAGPALRRAMALHEAGRLGEAERAYRRILRTDPASTGATHLLGVLLSQRGDHGRGVELIRRSISARAEPPTSYFFNLGKALEGQGAPADAAEAYRQTLAREPDNAEALNNLGNVLFAQGETAAALDSYRRAVATTPRAEAPRRNLCERLLQVGQPDEAKTAAQAALAQNARAAYAHALIGRIAALEGDNTAANAAFRTCLDLDPADPFNAAMESAALGATPVPDRAPAAFIRRYYGERAATWDQTAHSDTYHGHDLIERAVQAAVGPAKDLAILDLGCGTGELGRRLKPRAARLAGVDLSTAMATAAGHKGLYDELAAADLLAYLRRADATYDLVVAGAVLIHFGDLRPVLAAAHKVLQPGGVFVFTVFRPGANEVRSDFTCHTHDAAHVTRAAKESGFSVAALAEAVHEVHQGRPVPCLVATLKA